MSSGNTPERQAERAKAREALKVAQEEARERFRRERQQRIINQQRKEPDQ